MFRYLNLNPLSLTEEDCVTRAIALASGYSYAEIQDKLYYMSKIFECDKLCMCCYQHLLTNIFKYPKVECNGLTVRQFIDMYPVGTYIIRMDGHLSCISNGILYDIWDCSDEIITDAWYATRKRIGK